MFLTPSIPCHKLSHLLGPPLPSSVAYFMDSPLPWNCFMCYDQSKGTTRKWKRNYLPFTVQVSMLILLLQIETNVKSYKWSIIQQLKHTQSETYKG